MQSAEFCTQHTESWTKTGDLYYNHTMQIIKATPNRRH